MKGAGLTLRSTAPRAIIVIVAIWMTVFVALMALAKLRTDLWFVKVFLTGGKAWIWAGIALWISARVADRLEQRTKKQGGGSN
jgi:hypothetical protein